MASYANVVYLHREHGNKKLCHKDCSFEHTYTKHVNVGLQQNNATIILIQQIISSKIVLIKSELALIKPGVCEICTSRI